MPYRAAFAILAMFTTMVSSQMESLSKADLAEEAIESTGKEEEGKVLESSFKMAKMMMMMMMMIRILERFCDAGVGISGKNKVGGNVFNFSNTSLVKVM